MTRQASKGGWIMGTLFGGLAAFLLWARCFDELVIRGADLEGWKRELERTDRELDKIVDAILEGFPPAKLKDKAEKLEARKAELAEKLANADEPPPLLHPNMAALYAQRIGQLYENLQDVDGRGRAAETFRSLVDQITLMPDNGELAIVLRGDLGAILRFAAGKKNPDFLAEAEALDNLLSPGSLVAGAGFEPATFRL